ncbi:MAG: hypothetical protein AAF907_18450, partial [Planctomycetota bacterium]
MPDPDLLIVGGSVRAAAWCAVRAGLKVAALDRFNDLDLKAVAEPCFLWDGSDEQVERVVGDLRVPWMYTGPLENRPDLIDRCAELAPLRGNPGNVLRRVRDPFELHAALTAFRRAEPDHERILRVLDVRSSDDPPPFAPADWATNPQLFASEEPPWLLKPLNSCGGSGIAVWEEAAAEHPTLSRSHYFQRITSTGTVLPCSVSAEAVAGGVRPLGVCRNGRIQQLGRRLPRFDDPLLYGGPYAATLRLVSLLEHLRDWFGLQGLFGVDLLCDP